jgi:hypothetical protein
MDRVADGPERAEVSISEPAPSQLALPGLPGPELRCRHCGVPFATAKAVGRPRAFCSPSCRHEHAVDQRRAWSAARAAEASPAAVACLACGEAFTPPPRRHGRAAGFCSSSCRHAGRKALLAGYRARRRRMPAPENNNPERI